MEGICIFVCGVTCKQRYPLHLNVLCDFYLLTPRKKHLSLENCVFVSYHAASKGEKLKINIYRTIILPVVLYGCETWSLTLREERRLRVFENRVLRRVFGPKRDEVTGEWRKLHN